MKRAPHFLPTGLLLAAAMAVGTLFPAPAKAAQLIMFESTSCEWCEVWHKEIGVVYHLTEEGKAAPLRRVDVDDDRPADLKQIRGIVYTPTFIVIENQKEVGRIIGYPGEHFFWGLLDRIIDRTSQKIER